MKGKRIVVILTALLLLFSSACSGNEKVDNADINKIPADAAITIKAGLNTEKYERSTDISSLRSEKIEIAAAKGETEGGQFIVNANFDGTGYAVTVSDLEKGTDKISKDNVVIYTQIYSECTARQYGGVLPVGYYPDCLIPVEYITAKGENTLQKSVNQAFWVDVSVPRDAVAGTYTAEIKFSCKGIEVSVPLSVKAYDFEIYEVTALESAYGIWDSWIFYGEHDNSDETKRKYYDFLIEYNLASGVPPFDTAEEFVENVREFYPKLRAYDVVPPRYPLSGGYDYAIFQDMLYLLAKASVEDGVNYFDRAYYNFSSSYDESKDSSGIDKMTELINGYEENIIERLVAEGIFVNGNCEIAETIRNLRHVMTIDKVWAFSENVNFVCPKLTMIQYSKDIRYYVDLMEKQGYRVWTYNCIAGDMYPYYSAEINDYLFTTRENMWANYVNGFTGMLYWCVTGFCDWKADQFEPGKDVYSYGLVKDLYTTACRDGRSNGDGYMLYPGAPYGSEKPFPSLRITALRDGADDYTYMTQLDDLYKGYSDEWGIDGLNANVLVSYLTERIIGRNASKLNFDATVKSRDTIADAIIAAREKGLVFSELNRVNNRISYAFYAEENAEVKINGSALIGDTIKDGVKKYSGEYMVTANAGEFIIDVGGNTVSVPTGSVTTVLSDFETVPSYVACESHSSVSVNTDETYSVAGNSAKVQLNGYIGDDGDTSLRPYVYFSVFNNGLKLTENSEIEFYVYNDSDDDVDATLYLQVVENKVQTQAIYDVYRLKSKSWTKVEIDNVKVLSWRTSRLNVVDGFGLMINNPVKNGVADSVTLFIDELSYNGV